MARGGISSAYNRLYGPLQDKSWPKGCPMLPFTTIRAHDKRVELCLMVPIIHQHKRHERYSYERFHLEFPDNGSVLVWFRDPEDWNTLHGPIRIIRAGNWFEMTHSAHYGSTEYSNREEMLWMTESEVKDFKEEAWEHWSPQMKRLHPEENPNAGQ